MCLLFGDEFFNLSCSWVASSFFDEFTTFGNAMMGKYQRGLRAPEIGVTYLPPSLPMMMYGFSCGLIYYGAGVDEPSLSGDKTVLSSVRPTCQISGSEWAARGSKPYI